MTKDMTVLTLGVHVLDVLARPVEGIPDGQGAALLEQIKASAAGTAGGTALSLAKLGATVRSAGVLGAADLPASPAPHHHYAASVTVDQDHASRPPARRTVDGP